MIELLDKLLYCLLTNHRVCGIICEVVRQNTDVLELSKRDQGDSYGMVAYGGAAKEWNQQAAAFDAACVGKTAQEIQGLMGEDYKGVADLQAAGCTIYVSNFVKAATKIG